MNVVQKNNCDWFDPIHQHLATLKLHQPTNKPCTIRHHMILQNKCPFSMVHLILNTSTFSLHTKQPPISICTISKFINKTIATTTKQKKTKTEQHDRFFFAKNKKTITFIFISNNNSIVKTFHISSRDTWHGFVY